MKRVVLVGPHYQPESNAGSRRITSFTEALVQRGWQVTVVTLLPHHPQNKIFEGYDVASPHRSFENGVEVVRLRPWIVKKNNLVLRLISELLFCFQALPHLLRTPASIVVASSPYMFLGPFGLVASRLKGARFLWDVRDLTWLYPRAVGKRTFGLDRPLEALMLQVASRVDALTTVTEGLLNYFSRRPASSTVIANGVSDGWLEYLLKLPPVIASAPPQVLYAGLLGYNQGLSTLIDAAELLPQVRFVLAGDGPESAELHNLVTSKGLANVSMPGHLTQEQLLELYRGSTILVGHLRGDQLHRWSQPSKVWEYMATGRPVIYAGEGEILTIIDGHGIGLTAPPQQPEALAAAIGELLADPEKARELGARGREFVVTHRRRSALLERFVELLDDLLPAAS